MTSKNKLQSNAMNIGMAPGHSSKDADLESQLAHVVVSLTGVLAGLEKSWQGDELSSTGILKHLETDQSCRVFLQFLMVHTLRWAWAEVPWSSWSLVHRAPLRGGRMG